MKRRREDTDVRNVEHMIAGPSRMAYCPDWLEEDAYEDEAYECEACRIRIAVQGVDTASSSTSTITITTTPPLTPAASHPYRKPPNRPGTTINTLTILLLTLISPFITSAYAAPPLSRPNPSTPPTPTVKPINRLDVKYLTTVIYPTDIPTTTAHVDETELPYILTQSSDGSWQKADGGWSLYGRQAKSHNAYYADTSSGSAPIAQGTFAVQSVLPKGWGQQSSRTSFYRVPLIVSASCIIALGIVAGIVVLVLNRRKAHRRAKRRAERARRKALAAAGVNPDDINGNNAEVAFKEKLGELEKQHRSKRKEAGTFVKTKVKKWNAGLRRRKVKGDKGREGEGSMEVLQEDGEEDEAIEGVLPDGLRRRSTDSARSSPGSSSNDTGGSASVTPAAAISPATPGDTPILASPVIVTPYFPPAYRPASVRSYRAADAGPSRRMLPTADSEQELVIPTSETDKTRAPGYYPAPATQGAEDALAVVSRSDGKARVIPGDAEETRESVAHVATDDKRVLERMRLGASAPPTSGSEEGPSAPGVEVDEQGFERVLEEEEVSGSAPDHSGSHPDIPPPPKPVAQRSYRHGEQDVDEREILPSAPPDLRGSSPSAPPEMDITDAPSAPPLLEEDAEVEDQGVLPRAPGLEVEENEEVVPEEAVEEDEEENPNDEIPVVTPVRYLPVYEP